MFSLAKKIFGTKNDRELKRIRPLVNQVAAFEPALQKLSDAELAAKTTEFRNKLAQGATLNDIMPEAFAVCREGGRRVLGMRHFDVQLIGGAVLHEGKIAEMRTGEGKTLVATLPCYLNALSGKGVHVVTVNDYLAKRDSEWMGRLYKFLGLSVGVIVHGLNDAQRREAYHADITYGTNNEFGFDFLRDNMKFTLDTMVQREFNYAIVDEVDSILIDEARTPLIISGPAEESTDKYVKINAIIPGLEQNKHYQIDEKSRTAVLTEEGVLEVENRLHVDNLYDPKNIEILHHVSQALRAHTLYKGDVDYVVKDGKVIIVDEFTGRLMPGRRWSDGLHQAIEAKERVRIENENQTLASITFQNYFRMYKKLSGMTGTADTEAPEFAKIYNLEVVAIPTNRSNVREDLNDVIYKNMKAKFKAVVEDIKTLHDEGRPILVGTIAIEKSEILSDMLKRRGVPHNVLNAKHHEKEAEIVAQAGRYGAVTVSTNMAGRGTDIVLGGNAEFLAKAELGHDVDITSDQYKTVLEKYKKQCEAERAKVVEKGGLIIIGTERHESRRIDNQLRGRAGRQGDPGSTRFYVALDDDLMRIFGSDRIANVMEKLGMEEDETIEHSWISKAIENAQKKVEAHHFDMRKTVLEYDDVMNQQRTTVYKKRKDILLGADTRDTVLDMIDMLADSVSQEFGARGGDEFNKEGFEEKLKDQFGFTIPIDEHAHTDADSIGQKIYDTAHATYDAKEKQYGDTVMRQVERFFMLQTLDSLWKDHLLAMDHLREGIGLRGYGQKDPRLEYKKEGFALFEGMMVRFAEDAVQRIFKVQIEKQEDVEIKEKKTMPMKMEKAESASMGSEAAATLGQASAKKKVETMVRDMPKVGRNDDCPCGSGKKYKKCHGA
ncbi:preprotein translocase subunit SecA [bacterium]|nr:preprotein translocase subunit SecA [bacterium]